MRISSKPIFSSGHAREPPPISVPTSLSRRLRSSANTKSSRAYPMFSVWGKRKGSAFENPEPSSPKVTCIGQVRVKGRKQVKKMKTRPETEHQNGNADGVPVTKHVNRSFSFQNSQKESLSQRPNHGWVHLPFNCFLPCRSSCEREEKAAESDDVSCCGMVFAKFLAALQCGDVKQREIGLVVKEEGGCIQTKQVFDGTEFRETLRSELLEEDGARMSVCIPPKNALLLMRCRSDTVRVAALSGRFEDWPVAKAEDGDKDDELKEKVESKTEFKETDRGEILAADAEEVKLIVVMEEEDDPTRDPVTHEQLPEKEEPKMDVKLLLFEEETATSICLPEEKIEQNTENFLREHEVDKQDENGGVANVKMASLSIASSPSKQSELEPEDCNQEAQAGDLAKDSERSSGITEMKDKAKEDEQRAAHENSKPEVPNFKIDDAVDPDQSKELKIHEPAQRQSPGLPDCLLLMMYEPKLSMEVSRETWVCSTDFVRRPLTEKKELVNRTDAGDELKKRIGAADSLQTSQQFLQQPRSSISLPAPATQLAGVPPARIEEQKWGHAHVPGPFTLTRCKSEPVRPSVNSRPAACFFSNRKLEPPPPAALRVGF